MLSDLRHNNSYSIHVYTYICDLDGILYVHHITQTDHPQSIKICHCLNFIQGDGSTWECLLK